MWSLSIEMDTFGLLLFHLPSRCRLMPALHDGVAVALVANSIVAGNLFGFSHAFQTVYGLYIHMRYRSPTYGSAGSQAIRTY